MPFDPVTIATAKALYAKCESLLDIHTIMHVVCSDI